MPLPTMNSSTGVLDYASGQLRRAVADAKHPWHWPVFVTRRGGRVVVLRDVDVSRGELTVYSDCRAGKVSDLLGDAACSLVFYHGRHRTQLRCSGTGAPVDSEPERRRRWEDLHAGSQRSYATAHAPGTELDNPGDGLTTSWRAGEPSPEEVRVAFTHFCVIRCHVAACDFLQLGSEGQRRCKFSLTDRSASFRWVVP